MAWKGREVKQIDFSQLLSILNNSKIQVTNNALWQVIYQLIQNAQKNKDITVTDINKIIKSLTDLSSTVINNTNGLNDVKNATLLTVDDESGLLPNSRKELAGDAIGFDDTVTNQRTVNVKVDGTTIDVNASNELEVIGGAGVSYIPLSLGIEPLTFMSDGLGQPMLIPFIP